LWLPSQNGFVPLMPHPQNFVCPGTFCGGGSMGRPSLSSTITWPSTISGPAGFQVTVTMSGSSNRMFAMGKILVGYFPTQKLAKIRASTSSAATAPISSSSCPFAIRR
jgi:hypothetical protein